MKKRILFLSALVALSATASAQQKKDGKRVKKAKVEKSDSTVVSEHQSDRQIMANASSLDQPRDLDTGLGSDATPTTIFENGLPVSYTSYPIYAYQHWKPGSSLASQRMLGLAESAVRYGAATYILDSYALTGTNDGKFHGNVNIRFSSRHQQTYDGSIAIPIGKGWSTAISFLQDYNQGYNKVSYIPMQGRTQYFQWGVQKLFERGKVWAYYKYTDNFANQDLKAPALYHTNGEVDLMSGFKIGRDTYLPSSDEFTYMDVGTGKMVTTNFGNLGHAYISEAQTGFDYNLNAKLTLTGTVKYLHATTDKLMNIPLGQGTATSESGFSYSDGTVFTGKYQTRLLKREQATVNDFTATFELKKKTDNYNWTLGMNEWNNGLSANGSSAVIAQEVAVNPARLYLNGQNAWLYNMAGEYDRGHENRAALYWIHNFKITPRWDVRYAARLEDKYISVSAPFDNVDETVNKRVAGFSMVKEGVYQNHRSYNWIVPTGTFYTSYLINNHLMASLDGTFVRGRKSIHDWNGASEPDTRPSETIFASAGISYKNSWMDLASKISIMRQNNLYANKTISKTFDSYVATAYAAFNYAQQAVSWVNDINIYPVKNFNMHIRLTLQDPVYKNYSSTAVYDNGVTEVYSFSGNQVAGTSKFLMELDPSYKIGPFRISANVRYTGRSYVNITNTMKFGAQWDTFANIDYRLNKHVAFNLNIINLLNEAGISGSVSGADFANAQEALAFDNSFMAGTFKIPRTFLFTTKISF